ncbi:MAG TPA: thioredoxin [Candidatus Saccharimonadales bacterium]|nr:thioredoxin [Candidatus Saccharimonadales bacterium]
MAEPQVKLIDFWAAWCGPCKVMNPIIEEIEAQFAGKIVVEKIDVDATENQEAVAKYRVMAMPTYFVVKNGEVFEQFVGAQSKTTLINSINKALG